MSTTMYSPLVYPQAAPGVAYSQPPIPPTYIQQVFSPLNWNPYSPNSVDRTFYWSDSNGTLTEQQVLALVQGASGVAANQNNANATSCQTAITNGFTALGYTITLSATDQANGLAAYTSSQQIVSNSKSWSNNASVVAFASSILVNGNYYVCVQSGITGSTQPVLGTTFNQTYTDGNAAWQYAGFLLGTTQGNIWFTAQQVIQLYGQAVQFVSNNRIRYTNLSNTIKAIGSAPSTWTADATIALNSYIVINSILYQATTAGITGASLPSWNSTVGATVSDGTVVWTCMGNQIGYIQSLTF